MQELAGARQNMSVRILLKKTKMEKIYKLLVMFVFLGGLINGLWGGCKLFVCMVP